MKHRSTHAALFLIALLAWPGSAYAYLDPATGSLIIQTILGAIFAAGLTLKMTWFRIKAALLGQSIEEDPENADAAQEHPEDGEPPKTTEASGDP